MTTSATSTVAACVFAAHGADHAGNSVDTLMLPEFGWPCNPVMLQRQKLHASCSALRIPGLPVCSDVLICLVPPQHVPDEGDRRQRSAGGGTPGHDPPSMIGDG